MNFSTGGVEFSSVEPFECRFHQLVRFRESSLVNQCQYQIDDSDKILLFLQKQVRILKLASPGGGKILCNFGCTGFDFL